MSIASEITRINNNIAAAYSKCDDKGATMPQLRNSANLADAIDSIPQGGQAIEPKDINFYDYDGTLLYAYTAEEYTALHPNLQDGGPPLPSPFGIFDSVEWNWSLLQRYEITTKGKLDVAAVYREDSSNGSRARLYLQIPNGDMLNPTLWFYTAEYDGDVEISIDGEPFDTVECEMYTDASVEVELPPAESYPAVYCIEFYTQADEGAELCFGSCENSSDEFFTVFGNICRYNATLIKIELGSNYCCSDYSFRGCVNLQSAAIGTAVEDFAVIAFGSGCFQECSSLKAIVISEDPVQIEIGEDSFKDCVSLKYVFLPGAQGIGISSAAFKGCVSLKSVFGRYFLNTDSAEVGQYAFEGCSFLEIIETKYLSLGSGAFKDCVSLKGPIDIGEKNDAGGATYAFSGCRSLTKVTVLSSSVESYQFKDCYNLNEVVLTSSTRPQIFANAFAGCYSLKILDLAYQNWRTASNIPILKNVNALADAPSDMVIYVYDQTALNAFKAATNWSAYADRFQVKG